MKKSFFYALALVGALVAGAASAEDYVITLKDNKFTPQDLVVPAGQKIQIIVKNQGNAPAEFESHDLKIEKIVTANGQIVLKVGPLKAGTYAYVDEYNEDVAKGTITVK